LEDEQIKADYMRSQGLTAVDVGSRRALQKLVIPTFKKKTPGYKLKLTQLKAIWKK